MGKIKDQDLIDYSQYNEIFDNIPETLGSPFSELELKRREYMKENALNYNPQVVVPDIPELTPLRLWKAPSTNKFFRSVTAVESNGRVTFFSKKMNLKIGYWMCFPFLFWGCMQHVTHGIWKERTFVFGDRRNIYDKLHSRKIPYLTVWSRPG